MASSHSPTAPTAPLLLAAADTGSASAHRGIEHVEFDLPGAPPAASPPPAPPPVAHDAAVPSPTAAPAPADPHAAPVAKAAAEPSAAELHHAAPAPTQSAAVETAHEAAAPAEHPAPAEHAEPAAPVETVAHTAHPPAAHDAGDGHAAGPLDISAQMFLWTVGTFLLMTYVLTRFAWRPILSAIEAREKDLREAVDHADHLRQELATLDQRRSQTIAEADGKAKEIIDRARVAGREAGRVITEKAREDAAIIAANTERELRTAREKAAADLRRESVERALELAGRILDQKLDPDQHRELTDRFIAKL